jgi:hypothetical protein
MASDDRAWAYTVRHLSSAWTLENQPVSEHVEG